jgi:hypothetical protein
MSLLVLLFIELILFGSMYFVDIVFAG